RLGSVQNSPHVVTDGDSAETDRRWMTRLSESWVIPTITFRTPFEGSSISTLIQPFGGWFNTRLSSLVSVGPLGRGCARGRIANKSGSIKALKSTVETACSSSTWCDEYSKEAR